MIGDNHGELEYEYYLFTWGGFYNKQYQDIHKQVEGSYWFKTKEERDIYVNELTQIEKELNARHLAMTTSEGYHCRIPTILHRVVEYLKVRYYSSYDIGINYPIDVAKYHMEYKWYPGCNSYPLGDEFDYETNKVKTIQEWITGAFSELNEDE